jgi:hypothetical protein
MRHTTTCDDPDIQQCNGTIPMLNNLNLTEAEGTIVKITLDFL